MNKPMQSKRPRSTQINFGDGNLWQDLSKIIEDMEIDPADFGTYFRRAHFLCIQGRFTEALDDLNQAIKLEPSNPRLLNMRGKVLLDLNYPFIAKIDLDAAVSLDPADEDALTNRGVANMRLNHLQEALADFTELIRQDRCNSYALYNRAAIREQMEAGDAYVEDYEMSLSMLDVDSPDSITQFRAACFANMTKKFGFIVPSHSKQASVDTFRQ